MSIAHRTILLKYSKLFSNNFFGSIKDARLQSNAKNFLFFKVRIDSCKPCSFKEINTDHDYCILQPLSLSESDIFDCFLDHSKNCKDCEAPSLYSENYYCCLPKSIILWQKQQCPVNSKPVEIFDLDTSIKSAFLIFSKEYRLSCLLVRDKETIKGIINCSSESYDNPLANVKDADKIHIIAAFYDLKQKAASVKLMKNIRLTGNNYPPMQTKCFKNTVWKELTNSILERIQYLWRWREELQKFHTGCQMMTTTVHGGIVSENYWRYTLSWCWLV